MMIRVCSLCDVLLHFVYGSHAGVLLEGALLDPLLASAPSLWHDCCGEFSCHWQPASRGHIINPYMVALCSLGARNWNRLATALLQVFLQLILTLLERVPQIFVIPMR